VEKKIALANKIFMQIERLSNTERGLSFQAMRQLYIACISSVADYGVPVWWNNQKHFLEKFQKLQNLALRKILGVFKTSPIRAMEIEASLPPPRVRFNKICKNYALRTL
jgi:predicted component of type VI protein secretion system